jgi:phosphatidylinositol glycan class P protein
MFRDSKLKMTFRPPASPVPVGFYSQSTPNLPTLRSLKTSYRENGAEPTPSTLTSPSEAASIEDFSLDAPASIDSGSEDEEDGDSMPSPRQPMYQQKQSQSHTYLGPATFAPPFYNRPPTPLPPSPSLTSLLRPTFSTHASRPTTPDPSSDEGTSQTPNSAAATTLTTSFRTAKPIPRASPKVPTYEYYGFTLYLTSTLAFAIYLLWSYLPSPFLHQLGIYYYPNRWWSLAIPAWLVMLVVWIYVALASYNTGYLTLKMHAVECLVDDAANIAVVDAKGNIIRKDDEGRWKLHRRDNSAGRNMPPKDLQWDTLWNEGTDAVMDVPIGGVCEILYGTPDDDDDDTML